MSASKDMMSTADDVSSTKVGGSSSSFLLNQPIVMDNGTATIKAGFAGGSKPKVCEIVLQIAFLYCCLSDSLDFLPSGVIFICCFTYFVLFLILITFR